MLRIKDLRTEMGLTQRELGEKISSTSKNIWAYENEFSVPPLDVLIRLAKFFNCSLDYLSGITDDIGGFPISMDESLSQDEKELLSTYRKLSKQLQELANTYLKKLLEVNDYGTSFPKR